MKLQSIILGTSLLVATSANSAIITLLDEQFTGGNAPVNTSTATWSTTDAAGYETYGTGGFAARNMTPGSLTSALEVLASAADTTITISITLPADLDTTAIGVFNFFAGQRIGGGSTGGNEGFLEIFNVTDSRVMRADAAITNKPNFEFASNTENVAFLATDAGDTIEFRFSESASDAARGLQLADLSFEITTIPEPSSTALLGLGGLALILRRRK